MARAHGYAAVSIAALVTGCSSMPVQCAPCPPPVYVNLITTTGAPLRAAAGDTARICVQGLPCEERPGDVGTVALRPPPDVTPRQLDGRTVSVTATRAADGRQLAGSAVLVYRHGEGTCACSAAGAEVTLEDGTSPPRPQ